MKKISKRQIDILGFIKKNPDIGNQEILKHIQNKWGVISRITIVRDLEYLLSEGLLIKQGKGRSVKYSEAVKSKILKYVDVEDYFSKGPDQRDLLSEYFNSAVFKELVSLFSDNELKKLNTLNKIYLQNRNKLSPGLLKKEIERLSIELSWKSSQIEGNTYSLIDTETLIKQKKEAEGHQKEEAIMILNHKKSLDYIFFKPQEFKKLTIRKIENLHHLIVGDMGIKQGIRKGMVGITGTKYKPIDNEFQIKEALERTIKIINKIKEPFSKSIISILMISYIQAFEDGNKRTARILGNSVLLAHNICPLSYRSVDESDYKKAMVLFYEQNSGRYFKELFVEQFEFAVKNYFGN